MNSMNRRDFLRAGSLSVAGLYFSSFPLPAWASQSDNHFYVQFIIQGGWDPTYLFDARPLEMTQNKKLQNYHGKPPILLKGANGGVCWRTDITDPLMKHFDSFSVVNGVVMASSFDGHDQNMNYLLTGNPFGGASFLPYLAKKGKLQETAIVGMESGSVFANLNNHGEIIPLAGETGERLVKYLKSNPMVDTSEPGFAFIKDRYLANSQTGGSFSKANMSLISSMEKQAYLYRQLEGISFGGGLQDPIEKNVELMKNVFSKKVARLATILIDPQSSDPDVNFNVDTHFFEDAERQPQLYKSVVEQLATYFEKMRSIDFDGSQSLLDVSTFMVGSEFSRTMRQTIRKFEETGTDHNSLTNSLIIGGKGIKKGQIVGKSDYQSSHEVLSKAHKAKDSVGVKIMGAPFDYNTQRPSGELPVEFDIDDYLNVQNVTNTLMELFGVPKEHHWKLTNSGGPAKVLTSLI